MDTNSKFIQQVKSRPALYRKCPDLRKRHEQWKQVAHAFKLDVRIARSRWHILRSRFLLEYASVLKGKRSTYKYFNDMSFLLDNIDANSLEKYLKKEDLETHSEFIINSTDLKDDSGEDREVEFIELEDDAFDRDLTSQTQNCDDAKDGNEDNFGETYYFLTEEISNPPSREAIHNESVQYIRVSESENHSAIAIKETSNSKLNSNEILVVEEQGPTGTSNFTVDVPNEKNEYARSDDDIFGELVAATLCRMPSDKKKVVKKEIMNILFT